MFGCTTLAAAYANVLRSIHRLPGCPTGRQMVRALFSPPIGRVRHTCMKCPPMEWGSRD